MAFRAGRSPPSDLPDYPFFPVHLFHRLAFFFTVEEGELFLFGLVKN
jgi:hypothetical protein